MGPKNVDQTLTLKQKPKKKQKQKNQADDVQDVRKKNVFFCFVFWLKNKQFNVVLLDVCMSRLIYMMVGMHDDNLLRKL